MEVDAAEQLLVLCCFFAAFCEDFKSEINKLNKKNKLLMNKGDLFITKGNDAG